jgi:hypothetical protein
VRTSHRRALALYVVTLVAAVITLVDSAPARADGGERLHHMRTVSTATSDYDLAALSTT